MKATTLEKFGLTEGEARVYLALIRIGKSTIGNIIKEAHVSNSKVYDILDRLTKKGLVGVVKENNRRIFEAKSPEMLKENIKDQEKELNKKKSKLNKLLPELKGIYEAHEVKQEAEILKGTKGIKTFNERLLKTAKKGDTIYILGSPREAGEILEGYYIDWHKRRIKKGVKCKIIYNKEAEKFAKKRVKLKLADVKILPPDLITPVAIDFNNEEVGILVFGKNPFCFAVRNTDISNNYKKYFDYLWKQANPL